MWALIIIPASLPVWCSLSVKNKGLGPRCPFRAGVLGGFMIEANLSMAVKQQELHGAVTVPMLLVVAFQSFYLIDYFIHEEAVLTTWDIKHEKFGWILCWGDLVWLPFTYTVQAQYMANHPHDLPA